MSQAVDELVQQDTAIHESEGEVSPAEAEVDGGVSQSGAAGEKQVPVSEAIRYRRRAQQAERELQEARAKMTGLEAQLKESRAAIDALDRRQKAAALLAEAEAVDMEAAMLLTEAAVAQMEEPDVTAAIGELRRRRPYLFRQRRNGAAAMAARVGDGEDEALDTLAAEASASGDRRDLLRYLRMKRSK